MIWTVFFSEEMTSSVFKCRLTKINDLDSKFTELHLTFSTLKIFRRLNHYQNHFKETLLT